MKQAREGDSSVFNAGGQRAALELELSAQELLALSGFRAIGKPRSSHAVTSARNRLLPARPVSLALALAAAVLMGSVVALSPRPTIPTRVALNIVPATLAPVTEPPSTPQGEPVRFANPFDDTEVFEFPPGTSQSEARDAVASVLLKRARDRQNAGSNPTPGRRKNT